MPSCSISSIQYEHCDGLAGGVVEAVVESVVEANVVGVVEGVVGDNDEDQVIVPFGKVNELPEE